MSTSEFTPTLSEAQAIDVIVRGVTREVRTETSRTMAYCKDATQLRGFSVRKLANKAEDLGKISNSDSYQSNISNANGVMGLFEYDLAKFEAFLNDSPVKSLQALYKAFRALFVPKAEKPATPKSEPKAGEGESAETPQVDVVIAALAFLTPAERHMVVEACVLLGVELPEEAEVEETVAA